MARKLELKRNVEMYRLYKLGISTRKLAKIYDISFQRVALVVSEVESKGLLEKMPKKRLIPKVA